MGRKSEVGYYATKRGYFTTYKGDRYRLHTCDVDDRPDGPHYVAALEAFARLMKEEKLPSHRDDTSGACVQRWIGSLMHRAPSTGKVARSLLATFVKHLGHIRAPDLTGGVVLDWTESRPTWSFSTRYEALAKLRTCMKWNERNHYIRVDPLARMLTPVAYRKGIRGAEYVLHPALLGLLLAGAEGQWHDLLITLSRTGARPSELTKAQRFNYRPDEHAICHRGDETRGYVHKTAKSKRGGERDRWIYLDDEVDGIVKRNAARGPRLFPAPGGKEWTSDRLFYQWEALLRTPEVVDWMTTNDVQRHHVIPYSFRHTFITSAISNGKPIKLIADLCGTSVAMIERHYCHASADRAAMRKAYLSCL